MIAFAVLLALNIIAYFMGAIFYGQNEGWAFNFREGVFYLDDRVIGFRFFEPGAIGLWAVFVIASFAKEIRGTHS